jgi:hypothetical protein
MRRENKKEMELGMMWTEEKREEKKNKRDPMIQLKREEQNQKEKEEKTEEGVEKDLYEGEEVQIG